MQRLVVSDTGPLNYLVLADAIELLPKLFQKIFVPVEVIKELSAKDAPPSVRMWASNAPFWLDVREIIENKADMLAIQGLDAGERAALILARTLRADLILMDDQAAVSIARQRGYRIIGTLGVLDMAAHRGLIDLAEIFDRLKTTSFRYPPELMDQLLQNLRKGQRGPS